MKDTIPLNYYNFFLEIPPAEYLTDIEIQDEYENQTDEVARGLSEEQVSLIAVDSLSEIHRLNSQPNSVVADPSLDQA